jgi:hypothetical protein
MFCGSAVVELLDLGHMTCPLYRFATTTPTSRWSVSMPPGGRGSVSAAMRPLIGAIGLAQVEC